MPRTVRESASLPVEALEPEAFRKALRRWYKRHARKLPWRGVGDPYATWLSEIMLQQTRVATVIERYTEFLERFPTVSALAAAREDDVLALWSGLGYYRRARMLHRGAQFVERELGGVLPHAAADLRSLPGVGEYTAAAVASIAFGESVPVMDGNVERVLFRILGQGEDRSAAARAVLMRCAESLVPPAALHRETARRNRPGDHNQAMMELGATLCLPRNPLCLQCPVLAFCRTRGEHPAPPREKMRSRRVAYLLATRKRGTRTEILLEKRSRDASLMPGMLELPAIPVEAAEGREPVLRLRHSITQTNYYVEIYSESAPGVQELELHDEPEPARAPVHGEQAGLFVGEEDAGDEPPLVTGFAGPSSGRPRLREQVPAAPDDLQWLPVRMLKDLPLTGLARKTLQRLGLMAMHAVRVSGKDV